MPNFAPPNPFLVASSTWAIGKEAVSGTAATAFTTMSTAEFQPDDKPTPLKNQTLHGSAGVLYGELWGPIWAEHNVPESPLFGDTIGHVLLNFFGDYTTTGTSQSTTWTTSGALTPGSGPIAVTTGTAATAGTYVQIGTSGATEVVKVGTGSTTTSIVLDATTPIRFSHLSGATITLVAAPFTHVFSQLNPNSNTGVLSCQPPTHTLLHRTYIPGAGNNYATQYAYANFSELTLSGNAASKYVSWSGKATSWSRTYPSANVTPSFTGVVPWPSWESTNTIASSAVKDIGDWQVTLSRRVKPVPAANGQQAPYGIFRGPMEAKFDLTYDPVVDTSPQDHVLNNDQPSLAWAVTNSGSGSSLVAMTINAATGAFENAPLSPMDDVWGTKASGELVQSTSMAGESGGFGCIQVTLQNAIATY